MKSLSFAHMACCGLLAAAAHGFAAEPRAEAPCYPECSIDVIVPEPKQVKYSDERVTLWRRGAARPAACVVVKRGAPAAVRLAAEELSNRCAWLARQAGLERAAAARPPIVHSLAEAARFPAALAVGIGDAFGVAPPKELKPEGYVITSRREGARRVVVAAGVDARGAYYAAQSLQQLMRAEKDGIALRLAEVTDWPSYRIRSAGTDGSIPGVPGLCLRAVEWLPRFKLNAWAVGESYIWPDDWRVIPKDRLDALKAACRRAREVDVLDVIFQIHPFRGRSRDKQFNMVISNPKDVDRFIGLCDEMLSAGAKGILFRADDYHPLSEPDRRRFGDKAAAHAYLIREMHRRLKAKHPDYYLIFCPPYYHGARAVKLPKESAYLRKLSRNIPRDVHIMWTGPVTRSLRITNEQVAAFKKLIGRDPFLWDNTVYAHRSRYGYSTRHPGYFFDLFATEYPADYPKTCPGIRYNWGYNDNVLTQTGDINIADYLWNAEAYDPERSLRRALAILCGPDAVDDALALRDAYYTIKDAVDAGKALEPEVYASMEQAARQLKERMARLRRIAPAKVTQDISGAVRRVEASFQRVQAIMAKAMTARKGSLMSFDFTDARWKTETKGKWTVKRERESVRFQFSYGTRSFAGAYGAVSANLDVPRSPTGKYYLLFSVYDDYSHSGTPPHAWPGYLRKQVLVNGRLVWDDDVEGVEPPAQQAMQIVDVTDALRGGGRATITFRGYDRRGVGNMGAVIRFASACLIAGPCKLERQCIEIPDCPGLNPQDAFTIVARFAPRRVGRRQHLWAKQKPMQYFAFLHESGALVAGVFVGRKEYSVTTRRKARPGAERVFALVLDRGELRSYLNGRLEARRRVPGKVDRGAGPLCIGAYSAAGPYFDGAIHEFKIFSRALSAEELKRAMEAAGAAEGAKSLAFNPSCEQVDAQGRPLGWRVETAAPDVEWGVAKDAHTGRRSLRVRVLKPQPGREFRLLHAPTNAGAPGYPAAPNTIYRFSLWAKGDAGRVFLEPVGWSRGSTRRERSLGKFPIWVGAQWKRFEGSFITRRETSRFGLRVRMPLAGEGAAPTLWIDDLQIEQLPPGLAGWWRLDPRAPAARDLAGACPDGAVYRQWRVGR